MLRSALLKRLVSSVHSAINSLSHTQRHRENFSSGWRKFLFWDFNGCVAGSSLHISADRSWSESTTRKTIVPLSPSTHISQSSCAALTTFTFCKKTSNTKSYCTSHERTGEATNWNWRQSISESQQWLFLFPCFFEKAGAKAWIKLIKTGATHLQVTSSN